MVGRAALDLLILFLVTARAALVNRTIDDTDGDSVTLQVPFYQPTVASPWAGPSCVGCAIVPDTSLVFDGTWHAATYHPELLNVNITFSFTGVSIWVFFVLANNNTRGPGITSNTECNFTLDGQLVGYFNHQPDESTNALQYNVIAFNNSNLSNSQHEMVISTNDLPYSAYLNFDYAIYTVDIPDSASVSATPTDSITTTSSTTGSQAAQSHSLSSLTKLGIILGCVLGGLMLIVLVVVFMLFRRLKRKERSHIQHPVSAFNQEQPQSYRDEHTMSDSHIPWGSFNDQQSHIRSPSSNLASEVTLLVPARRDNQPLSVHPHSTKSRDELRALRQTEINRRLQNAQHEIYNLTSRQSMRSGPGSSTSDAQGTENEMETMREQIRQLRTQIEHLQSERSSDWALGLSDNPPPAYV